MSDLTSVLRIEDDVKEYTALVYYIYLILDVLGAKRFTERIGFLSEGNDYKFGNF